MMHNHIQNKLSIYGTDEAVQQMLRAIRGFQDKIDFNTIIPCPYYFTVGSPLYKKWNAIHWGTKWNAFDQRMEGHVIYFKTENQAPFPVIKKLKTLFPKIKINHEYTSKIKSAIPTG